MKKQFFRVKQLADQTLRGAEKSEILNHEELQLADQRIEFLRSAISTITKKIAPSGPTVDVEKLMRKTLEYQLGNAFLDESRQLRECHLFQAVLRESGLIEQHLARDFAEHEMKVEELVYTPLQNVLENEFPNILKLKHNLRKYCLDKDSASSRYHATGKETLKEDMEEADTKVEQSRDALAIEMYNVLAKENEFSEYILQMLKLQRSYHESALKNLQNLIPHLEKRIGDSSVRKVFGTSLKEHLRITGKRIAYPLEICVTALSEYGLQEEGLFRVAASTSKVKRLKSAVDSGCFSMLIPEYRDVHILASLLKLYLRELPEPLLTFHLHKEWIEAVQVPENQRLEVVRNIINRLPPENKDNLSYLFQFLSKLTKHPENKMSASNIAIVLSPNLLWDKHESLNVNIGNCVTVNVLIELFVKEVDVLFPDDVSRYVTLPDNFHDDDSNYKSSNTNLNVCADSPKPSTRKKKSAPVPPGIVIRFEDDFVGQKMPADSPPSKNKNGDKAQPKQQQDVVKVKPPVEAVKQVSTTRDNVSQTTQRLIGTGTKADRATMTENVINVNKSQQLANSTGRPPEQKFITNVVHKVVQPNMQSVIPDSNKSERMVANKGRPGDALEDGQLRRKDPSTKPEIPARPSSLSVLKSSIDVDGLFKRTQCSVYNVANKQQPSFINIHGRNETFQPGHDNQIGEKEKFLGHKPEPAVRDNNSNCKLMVTTTSPTSIDDGRKVVKSSEQLNVCSDAICDNGNQKSSHARTRSDGGMIDLDKGGGNVASLQLATRNLSKPTQPPPPPPSL